LKASRRRPIGQRREGANAVNLPKTRVVIVGAGQAGGRAAEALRAAGHVGPITLIGEEAHLPYERPQLSKSILIDSEPHPAFIRAHKDWVELDVTLSTSSRVVAADIERREIGLEDGKAFAFDQLLLTTAASIREIARACGYTSLARFGRDFQRAHGCAPRVWRAHRTLMDVPFT